MTTLNQHKATNIFSIFLIVMTLTSFVSDTLTNNWKTYKNKDYKFLVKFPRSPNIVEEKGNNGKTISIQHLNDATGQMYYLSVFHSPNSLEIEGLRDLAIKTFTEELEGALLESKDIENGKEAVISLGSDSFIIYQVQIVHDKMYQIIATTTHPKQNDELKRYFNSFKVLK
tara:strand:+ start:231 stop:743 length:513 start_codon:yes stop_codon:yes gene_type:complete